MIKKLLCQHLQRACVIPLLFVSLTNYLQSVQAQLPNSQNTVKNSHKQSFKEPKLPDNGAPSRGRRRAGAGRNPKCPRTLENIAALVPGDGVKSSLASTVAEHPTFWFYVPELPETTRSAEFVLQVEDGQDVEYRKAFILLSGKRGIISITLPQYSLKADKKYHWYFHIYCGDPKKTSDNLYVDGFVQKLVLDQALDSQFKTANSRKYVVDNANDALTNLGQLRRAHQQDATFNKDWVELLNKFGLQDLVNEPIGQDYKL